jgi:hypothetical protein
MASQLGGFRKIEEEEEEERSLGRGCSLISMRTSASPEACSEGP